MGAVAAHLSDQEFSGAANGIRTRDPHLGKVVNLVPLGLTSPLYCGSVHPVFTPVHRVLLRSRALCYWSIPENVDEVGRSSEPDGRLAPGTRRIRYE